MTLVGQEIEMNVAKTVKPGVFAHPLVRRVNVLELLEVLLVKNESVDHPAIVNVTVRNLENAPPEKTEIRVRLNLNDLLIPHLGLLVRIYENTKSLLPNNQTTIRVTATTLTRFVSS